MEQARELENVGITHFEEIIEALGAKWKLLFVTIEQRGSSRSGPVTRGRR